ncbi:MAG: DUF1566 domain-containing protein [Myxococcales bacterium]|nr:MAG: DUF1566 domain-containing protein [Myxococcales bacterium]
MDLAGFRCARDIVCEPACTGTDTCIGGICVPPTSCLIAGVEHADGDPNSNNPCEECNPLVSQRTWSPNGWCWFDPETKLIWQDPPVQSAQNWTTGNSYCDNLELGGLTSWTLPTINQLRTLIRDCEETVPDGPCGVVDGCSSSCYQEQNCNGCNENEGPAGGCYFDPDLSLTTNTEWGSCGEYWSSSTYSSYAWSIVFSRAYINRDHSQAAISNTRCVHACTADCANRECGPDGCGGWCEPNDCGIGECNWETGLCEEFQYNGCETTDCADGECIEISGVGYCECPTNQYFDGESCRTIPVENGQNPILNPSQAEPGHFVMVTHSSIQPKFPLIVLLGDLALIPYEVKEGSLTFMVPPIDPTNHLLSIHFIESDQRTNTVVFEVLSSTAIAPTPVEFANTVEARTTELDTMLSDAVEDLKSEFGVFSEDEANLIGEYLRITAELSSSIVADIKSLQGETELATAWQAIKYAGIYDLLDSTQLHGERPATGKAAQDYLEVEYWFSNLMRRLDTADMLLTNTCSGLTAIELACYAVGIGYPPLIGLGVKIHKLVALLDRFRTIIDLLPTDINSIEMSMDRQFVSSISMRVGENKYVDFRGDYVSEETWEESIIGGFTSVVGHIINTKYLQLFRELDDRLPVHGAFILASRTVIDWFLQFDADLVANVCDVISCRTQNHHNTVFDQPLSIINFSGSVWERLGDDLYVSNIAELFEHLTESNWFDPGRENTVILLSPGICASFNVNDEYFSCQAVGEEGLELVVYNFKGRFAGLFSWMEDWNRDGLSVTCLASCECSSGLCCDGCNYYSSSRTCNSDHHRKYRCEGSGCGDDGEEMIYIQKCSGYSVSCDGSVMATSWQEVEWCSGTEKCGTDDDSVWCSYASECDCECSSGDCCDGCNYRSSSYVCEIDAISEYGCPWGTACGNNVGVRSKDRYCTGGSNSCSGSYGAWKDWFPEDDCSSTEVCALNDSTCNYSFSCDIQEEICNGVDDDGDGTVDELESCWIPVYRFWNDEPLGWYSFANRCYSNSASPPSSCSWFRLDHQEPIFYLYSGDYWPGGGAIVSQFWKQNTHLDSYDHFLTIKYSQEYNYWISHGGYQYIGDLGYLAPCGTQPVGNYYKPNAAVTNNIRELQRWYCSGVESGYYSHFVTTAESDVPTNACWELETNLSGCYVWGSRL